MNRKLFVTQDAQRFFRKKAGQPYRPSNGTEGMVFIESWCCECRRYRVRDKSIGPDCRILGDSFLYDVKDPKYPKEWRWRWDGQPECTGFRSVNEKAKPRYRATLPLFPLSPRGVTA